jgi:hypothetical protein
VNKKGLLNGFSAKNEDIQVERMAQTLKDLTNGLSKPSR